MLSISHTAKVTDLAFQTSNRLFLHEPSSLYAHEEQCPSYFLSEVRLYASDPVQGYIKGKSLCKPC